MKKPIKRLAVVFLAIAGLFGLAACTSGGSETTPSKPAGSTPAQTETGGNNDKTEEKSVIKTLTAKAEQVTMRLDETKLITTCYDIVGYKALSAANKQCTYEVSDPSIIKITKTSMKAIGLGNAKVTVTSKADPNFKCEFNINVKDVYFDRELSSINGDDLMDAELPADGGSFTTGGNSQGDYYIKGTDSTKWFVTVDITVLAVNASEKYPKFGIVTSTTSNTDPTDNKLFFFLNAEIGDANVIEWANFGACEVNNGAGWAWNPGINDAMARHKNTIYTNPSMITYNTKWTISVARDGFNFHMWVNNVYAGSLETLHDLFGKVEGTELVPANSTFGFFQFNSQVKYENYSYTLDDAEVTAKIASIENPVFVETWDQDAA